MNRNLAIGLGIVSANGFALVITGLTSLFLKEFGNRDGTLVLSEFVVLPLLMGMINTLFWRKHGISTGEAWRYGFLNLLIALLGSWFFMGEGYICLVIVSPLLILFLMLGIWFGRMLFKRGDNRLNFSAAAALAALLAVNVVTVSPSMQVVTDQVVIHASPEQVWKYIVSFPAIEEKPDYWLFRIGLPNPVQSVADGEYVGADRQCIFNDGIVFEEKIVELEAGRKLTFDIVKQPEHPEIMGHLELLRGQFLLQDNGDGTTTLTGHSWYDLKVKPSLYFDWWTQNVITHVHLRVMNHIKELSEKDAGNA